MPAELVFVLCGLIIFAWFVFGGATSFGEKITVIIIFIGIYVFYRMLNGASPQEIFIEPIVNYFKR